MIDDKRPIFVTGCPRSGTTWVGLTLSKSPFVGYIHEPFNINTNRPGIFGGRVDRWFVYVTADNEEQYRPHVAKMLAYEMNWPAAFRGLVLDRYGPRRLLGDVRRMRTLRQGHPIPLVKDPLAVFSTPWLAERFDMRPIILIRHPAAVASSLKRLGWRHSFRHLLEQPLLMRDYLEPLRAEIAEATAKKPNILDEAALWWKVIHHAIRRWRDDYPEWIFLRHEDLSLAPPEGFERLCARLDLPFEGPIAERVRASSSKRNPSEVPAGTFNQFNLDSRAIVHAWKERLSEEEIARVRRGVEGVVEDFYDDSEW